jgi:phosphohistidine phosphatase SixA
VRLRAYQSLLEWVADNAATWTAGQRLNGADLILLSIFARSTRTYEAIVRHLGNHGFGEQGLMLTRSLFEDMVDAH